MSKRPTKTLERFCATGAIALLALSTLGAGCRHGADAPYELPTSPPIAWATPGTPAGTPSAESSATPSAPVADGQKLVIAWTEGIPAQHLQSLCADFTQETGIPVEVQQIASADFENTVRTVLDGQEATYDLIVGDTQWLGRAASAGQYLDLSEWSKTSLTGADIAPTALSGYGEYPGGSGRLYAVPCQADVSAFIYRKDLFADANNKSAFKARYKRDLAPPKTWEEFQDIAAFFTKPDGSLYGAALFYGQDGDDVTMGFEPVLWSYGGKWCEGKRVDGIVNSPAAVKALEYYASLKRFAPPSSATYGASECLSDFQQGKVALAQVWLSSLSGTETDAASTGIIPTPQGAAGQFTSLGGSGIAISAYSAQPDNAKRFLQWFATTKTQTKWATLGGLTANTKVMGTGDFKKAPYSSTLAASIPYAKDFYNTPEAADLLAVTQRELNQAVAGTKTAKDALDTIAREHQGILDGIK